MKILLLPGSHQSPSSRFRIWQFAKPLEDAGCLVDVKVTTPPRDHIPTGIANSALGRRLVSVRRIFSAKRIARAAGDYDIVYTHKDLVPEIRGASMDVELCRRSQVSLFDFDDAIHLGRRGEKLIKTLPHYSAVVAGNQYLAEFAERHNPNVHIWPTVVDTDYYSVRGVRDPGPVRVGWSGSHHTLKQCLPILKDAMESLAKIRKFEFIVIANQKPDLKWADVNWRYIPWSPETEVEGIGQIDIGLMPLADSPFERGKCGLKAIQYMAVGTPALVSPVGVNRDIVDHGENGYHCNSTDDWVEYAAKLIDDQEMRSEFGVLAARKVRQLYSVESLLPRMMHLFEKLTQSVDG